MNEQELAEKLQERLAALQDSGGQDLGSVLGFTWSGVISGLLFGIAGMWLLRYARRRTSYRLVAVAFALMFYPYVTNGPLQDWGVGIALCGLAYWQRHNQ